MSERIVGPCFATAGRFCWTKCPDGCYCECDHISLSDRNSSLIDIRYVLHYLHPKQKKNLVEFRLKQKEFEERLKRHADMIDSGEIKTVSLAGMSDEEIIEQLKSTSSKNVFNNS